MRSRRIYRRSNLISKQNLITYISLVVLVLVISISLFTDLEFPTIEKLLRGRINTKVILENYDDVLRLAHSIREGKVSGSLIMGKLGSYSRQNRLATALREMGSHVSFIHSVEASDTHDATIAGRRHLTLIMASPARRHRREAQALDHQSAFRRPER